MGEIRNTWNTAIVTISAACWQFPVMSSLGLVKFCFTFSEVFILFLKEAFVPMLSAIRATYFRKEQHHWKQLYKNPIRQKSPLVWKC